MARELGAEIVIGVDVQADLMKEDKLESVSGVIPQIINLLCMNKHEANVKLADLVIRPDMKGYTAASFIASPGKSGGFATMVRDHAGKRIDRGVRERGQRDPESPSTGKNSHSECYYPGTLLTGGRMGASENADRGK